MRLDEDKGGVKIDTVSPDTVAAAAGLKKGDVIISMSGKPFARDNPLQELRNGIAAAKPGKVVEIIVIRDGGKVKLKARWEK